MHAMRHSAATIALDEGVALAVVQELLGHSDIRVTRELRLRQALRASRLASSPWRATGAAR
jgi:site-specific recombinase XerD